MTAFDLDSALDSPITSQKSGISDGSGKLNYVRIPGVIDLSYSRRQTLNSCPRKFLLREIHQRTEHVPTAHTAYGHAFAAGVQNFLVHKDEELAVIATLAAWNADFDEEIPRDKKSIFWAVHKVRLFINNIYPLHFKGKWEVARLNDGRPAVELFYYIHIDGSHSMQGHIDVVLQSVEDSRLCVLEVKTGTRETNEANWANSDQTLGYNFVLDGVAQRENLRNRYNVIYLFAQSTDHALEGGESGFGFTLYNFPKSPKSRADYVSTLLLDIARIQLYKEHNFWPKNGNSCRSFNRNCEFFGTCDLQSMQADGRTETYEAVGLDEVDYEFTLDELLAIQSVSADEFNYMQEKLP